jgi:protein-tyrosine-phosphatase
VGGVTRVLFVCAGNICRSPMAEAFLRQLAAERPGLRHVEVASAGTLAIDGNSPLATCAAILRDHYGLDLSGHRARRLTPQLEADLVLAMDRDVLRAAKAAGVDDRLMLIGDYAGSPGEEVPDPYGASEEAYRRCAEQIRRLVTRVADRLEAEARAGADAPEGAWGVAPVGRDRDRV